MFDTRRREFITLLGGSGGVAVHGVRAAADRMRRIGGLMSNGERDPESQLRLEAFREGLQKFGWAEGRNLRIDYRWGGANHRPHSHLRSRTRGAETGRYPRRSELSCRGIASGNSHHPGGVCPARFHSER